jgi:hypoxanthine-guanine phosphoribosyltransferase
MFNNIKLNSGLGEETIWKVIEDKDVFRINDVVKLGRYRYKLIDMITTPAETESQCINLLIKNKLKHRIHVKFVIKKLNRLAIRCYLHVIVLVL